MFKDLKFDFPAMMALVVVGAFILIVAGSGFTAYKADESFKQTLVAIVMLIVGYYYGSSTGSKAKDAKLNPPPVVSDVVISPPAPPAA